METYNSNTERYESASKGTSLSLVRVFLYLAAALLVTFGVGYGWPFLIVGISGGNENVALGLYIGGMVVAVIYMLIGGFMLSRKAFQSKTISMAVMYYLYAVAMGILCSSIFYVATIETLGNSGVPIIAVAFGISAGCMLISALIAFVFRKKMNILIPIVFALLIGIFAISMLNIFLFPLTAATGTYNYIYWIVDYAMFAVILLITAIDLFKVQKMAANGWINSETNLAYYAAYTIYVDYIWILIRVISYLLAANRN